MNFLQPGLYRIKRGCEPYLLSEPKFYPVSKRYRKITSDDLFIIIGPVHGEGGNWYKVLCEEKIGYIVVVSSTFFDYQKINT